MKRFAYIFLIIAALFPLGVAAQGISQLQQFTSTTSPSSAITQTTYGKALKITGLTTGQCLTLNGSSILTTTACGSGGGSSFGYPFVGNSTSTLLTFIGGLLSHASTTINGRFELPALSAGELGVDATGKVYSTATTTAGTGLTYSGGAFNVSGLTTSQFASANISQWTNNSGYLTSLAGAASSTLLGDSNKFSGTNTFTNTITGSISGNAGTATAFASTPTKCSAGNYPLGIDASGNAQNCTAAGGGGSVGNWFSPFPNYNATSTALGLLNGFFSTASSTFSSNVFFPNLTQGLAFIGTNGLHSTVSTSTLTASSPLTGSFTQIGSGGSLGIQAASASQNGYLSNLDYSLLHTATTTFTSPLVYTLGTNAVTLTTSGTWSGNAGTATALAANGTNCSAGNYPLGVDASGNSEGCTAAGTGTVTSVTATYPILSTGGTTPVISTAFGTTSSTGLPVDSFIYTSHTGVLLGAASSSLSLPNAALQNSSVTVNTSAPLGGGGSVSLGGAALTLTCTSCTTFAYPFTNVNDFATSTAATSTSFYTAGVYFASSTMQASQFPYASTTMLTATTASTTNLITSGIRSALIVTSSNGVASAYGGASACTNQVVTAISATGGTTCTSVANAMLTNSSVTITPISYELSGGGAVSLGNTITINATTSPTVGYITATSTSIASNFPYASSTNLTATLASSTSLIVSSAGGSGTRCAQFDSVGTLSANASACGSGGGSSFAYPFTYATTYNTLSAGTSTPLWLQGSPFALFASSTSVFSYASTTMLTATLASTTNLTVSGIAGCNTTSALTTNTSGVVACGSISGGGGGVTGTTGQVVWLSGTNTAVGTSTIFIDSSTGAVGISTTSPSVIGLTVGTGTIFNPELALATSTSMSVGVASSTQQLLRYSTSAITVSISTYKALPGTKTTLVTCSQASGTAGAITFSNLHYSGGVQPGNTTTANQCDMWYITVIAGTSTQEAVLTGMTPGIQ